MEQWWMSERIGLVLGAIIELEQVKVKCKTSITLASLIGQRHNSHSSQSDLEAQLGCGVPISARPDSIARPALMDYGHV